MRSHPKNISSSPYDYYCKSSFIENANAKKPSLRERTACDLANDKLVLADNCFSNCIHHHIYISIISCSYLHEVMSLV